MEENEKNMQKISDDNLATVSGGYERRTPINGFDKGFFRPKALSGFQKNYDVIDPAHVQEDAPDLIGVTDEEV